MKGHVSHKIEQCGLFSTSIVNAVAEAEKTTPDALTPLLFDVIDPDALDQLLQHADETTHVTFSYGEWAVEARGNGTIDVTRPSGEE